MKGFHIIAMVAWFAGLFYLPRLFVYHTEIGVQAGKLPFCTMERRLYYAIMYPAAIITTLLGIGLIHYNPNYYLHAGWMQIKLVLVVLLWVFHLMCGRFVKQFAHNQLVHSSRFYRIWNEIPTLLLIAIVLLAVVKPW
jgi:putative membrane protein